MKGIKEKDLNKIQNMSYEQKKLIVANLPVKLGSFLYSSYCDSKQLKDLFFDWDLIVSDPVKAVEFGRDVVSIQDRHIKKIKGLIKALRKQRKKHLIPVVILDRYK